MDVFANVRCIHGILMRVERGGWSVFLSVHGFSFRVMEVESCLFLNVIFRGVSGKMGCLCNIAFHGKLVLSFVAGIALGGLEWSVGMCYWVI